MADAVSSQTLFDGERIAVMKFINVSDGTGEAAVTKVTVSALAANALGKACDAVSIERIDFAAKVMGVNILWGATSDVSAFVVSPDAYSFDFCKLQLVNNAGAGKTGNIKFTTISAAAGATYSIVLTLVKHYAP